MKNVLFGFLLNMCCVGMVFSQTVVGRVFLDANQNGIYDKSERLMKSIPVSNGKSVVQTDKKGGFVLAVKPGQSVFPIVPTGYALATSKGRIKNTKFLYVDEMKKSTDTISIDIPLSREVQSDRFRIGAIGDVQVDTEEELGYAAKSVLTELTQRNDIQFNILLGDLVNDKMALMPQVRAVLDKTSASYWTVLGNHDRNTSSTQLSDVFNRELGADTYAFNYGGVHFVVLNNVFATGNKSYEGRVSVEQLAFLEADLKLVPKNTTIVLSQHIPMAHTHNQKEILTLLKDYQKVLILTGHTHTVNRYFFKHDNIHELGCGATCGNWWRGEKDMDGVPQALMQCGTPRGYFTVDFRQGGYQVNYKGVGIDEKHQMDLVVDTTGLVLNVFGGSEKTKVELQIDDSPWVDMQQQKRVAPSVQAIRDRNQEKIYPTQGNTRNPLGTRVSSHIWGLEVPEAYKGKMVKVKIRAKDDFGFAAEQEFITKL